MRTCGSRIVAAAVIGVALCAAASAVPLELKLEEGKTYYVRMTVNQQIVQDMMGTKQTMHNDLGTMLKMDVLHVNDRGNMRIRSTYAGLLFKQAGPMANVEYDSVQSPTDAPSGAEGFAALLNQSYTIELSRHGEVLDVNGVDELGEAVRKKLPAGSEGTPMMTNLTPFISEGGITEISKGTFAVYTDQDVEPGDSWTTKTSMTLGPELHVESKWTLEKRQAGVATISRTSTVRSNPDSPPIDAGQMKLKFDLSGTEQSTIRLAEATGLILMNRSTQQVKGNIQLATSADAAPMMTVPITFETASKIEMSDRMWPRDDAWGLRAESPGGM